MMSVSLFRKCRMAVSSGVGAPRSKPAKRIQDNRSRSMNSARVPNRLCCVCSIRSLNIETGSKGGRPPFGAVAIAEPCDQPAPERLKIHRPFKGFKRVPAGADARQLLLKAEKAPLIYGKASIRATKPVDHETPEMGRFWGVSSCGDWREVVISGGYELTEIVKLMGA